MSRYKVFAGRLVSRALREAAMLEVEEGRIAALRPAAEGEQPSDGDLDARDAIVVPGFIDSHVHGGVGLDVMDGQVETIHTLASHLPSRGVTAFLVTPLTSPWPPIRDVVAAAREARRSPAGGAAILGCHIEGPFINPRYKGAQNPEFIAAPDFGQVEKHLGDLLTDVWIMTIAPEMPGALDAIRHLTAAGVRVSVGHTAATYDEVSAAIDAGATRATHCYNAMRGMHHREPGTVGAVLTRPELTAEIIWDNIHVHPSMCTLLCRAKGTDQVVAVSDGTSAVGMPDGYEFELWGLQAVLNEGAARLKDGGALAGSAIALDDAFRNAHEHLGLVEAVNLCSLGPARSLGLDGARGHLDPGAQADFVVLSPDLGVRATFVGGREVYRSA
jgi:N-acetylglucosamine-6-phosphate deacetylase